MNRQECRINIYNTLSEALKEPRAELSTEQAEIIEFLQKAFEVLQYPIAYELYKDWPQLTKDIKVLSREYAASFLYPATNRVIPVESIYRQWTLDTTAEVPFAKEKGYFMSDFALHIQALYIQYGINIPEEYSSMPDHLCLELEFAGFLLQHATSEQQGIFISEHLNWVDELYQDGVKNNIPVFYRQVIQVTAEFLKYEGQFLASAAK